MFYRINEIREDSILELINENDSSDRIEIKTILPFREGDLISNTPEGWCLVDRFAELLASTIITHAAKADKNDPEAKQLIEESKKDLLEAAENRRVMSREETINFLSYREAIQELMIEKAIKESD